MSSVNMPSSLIFNRSDSKKIHARLILIIKGYMVCLIVSGCLMFLYFLAVFSVVTEIRSRQQIDDRDTRKVELFVTVGVYLSLLVVGVIKQLISWIGVFKHSLSWIYGIIFLDVCFLLLSIASLIFYLHYASMLNLVVIVIDIIITTVILWEILHLPENRPEVIELQASLNKSISSRTSRKSERNGKFFSSII